MGCVLLQALSPSAAQNSQLGFYPQTSPFAFPEHSQRGLLQRTTQDLIREV